MPNWVANRLTIHGEAASSVLRSLLTTRGETECIDFNKIKLMPESLQIDSGTTTNYCIEIYLTSINPAVNYYGTEKMAADKFQELMRKLNTAELSNDGRCRTKYKSVLSTEAIHSRLELLSDHFKSDDFEKLALDLGKTAINNVEKYGALDWYEWSTANWGTKWNASDCRVFPDNNIVEFNTAWAPVVELISVLASQHPECAFDYVYAEEQAGTFAGKMSFADGKDTTKQCYFDNSKDAYEIYFDLWGGREDFVFNEETNSYDYAEQEDDNVNY